METNKLKLQTRRFLSVFKQIQVKAHVSIKRMYQKQAIQIEKNIF